MEPLKSKFVETSSLWGNLYRHRYFIDGWRVSEVEWDRRFKAASNGKEPKDVSHHYARLANGNLRSEWNLTEKG